MQAALAARVSRREDSAAQHRQRPAVSAARLQRRPVVSVAMQLQVRLALPHRWLAFRRERLQETACLRVRWACFQGSD